MRGFYHAPGDAPPPRPAAPARRDLAVRVRVRRRGLAAVVLPGHPGGERDRGPAAADGRRCTPGTRPGRVPDPARPASGDPGPGERLGVLVRAVPGRGPEPRRGTRSIRGPGAVPG